MDGNSELTNVGLGKDRAEAIRALVQLPLCVSWVKCPFTGSSDDPMRIWRWEKTVHIDMNNDSVGHNVKATCDADVKDLNQLEGTAPNDTAKSVAVKAEPTSDADVAAENVKLILEDAAPCIRQLRDTELKEANWSQTMRRRRHEGAARADRYENRTHHKNSSQHSFQNQRRRSRHSR